jgi:hypothetical protein
MNKKSAFTVVAQLPRKMAWLMEFSDTDVPFVAGNSWVGIGFPKH